MPMWINGSPDESINEVVLRGAVWSDILGEKLQINLRGKATNKPKVWLLE